MDLCRYRKQNLCKIKHPVIPFLHYFCITEMKLITITLLTEASDGDSLYFVIFNDKNEEVDINSTEGKDNDGTMNLVYICRDSKIARIIVQSLEHQENIP